MARITDKRIGYRAPGATVRPKRYYNNVAFNDTSQTPTTWYFGAGGNYFVYLPIGHNYVPVRYLNEIYMLVPHDKLPQRYIELDAEVQAYIDSQLQPVKKSTKKTDVESDPSIESEQSE